MIEDRTILTVSELTRRIKTSLEQGFPAVAVQGEISNFKQHSSGHLYFTIKDEHAQVQAVVWRSRASALIFTPQDGMKVVARGRITVYEVRGVYQIDVVELRPLGTGELQLAFERLKQKLAAAGYFDPKRKKPIPRYPRRIGIVTSPTGAAIRDIVTIISRRWPVVELVLYPVNVQGPGASGEIAGAIRDLNAWGGADVLIVGRGGGSLEDLWAFNEETVAQAIYESAIPVISAVGHEIDFTIADFVADLRAPTPSAAAELVVPSRAETVEIVRNFCYTMQQNVEERVRSERERILGIVGSYAFNRPLDLLRQYSQQLDELRRSLVRIIQSRSALLHEQCSALSKRIESVNPSLILRRGYVIVRRNGEVVDRAKRLRESETVHLNYYDGTVGARVLDKQLREQ
ncbi:MAG TPA: exodeoxyribonuclease VII large subunit [Bacteroidota bacterium]|nr:exodeoxyribonuclease VII large subunit [Bacteroidota bacterium]